MAVAARCDLCFGIYRHFLSFYVSNFCFFCFEDISFPFLSGSSSHFIMNDKHLQSPVSTTTSEFCAGDRPH